MTNRAKKRILFERDKVLQAADRRGQSKFEAKQSLREDAIEKGLPIPHIKGIYSHSTMATYRKESTQFIEYAAAKGGDEKHLTDLCKHVAPYLKGFIEKGLSAWTIYIRATALASIFECHVGDFGVDLPKRERRNIKRTRSTPNSVGDRYQQEKYAPIRDFITATGARRVEIGRIKRDDIHENDGGTMSITLHGKGGKTRTAPVLPGMEGAVRTALAQSVGYGKDGQYVFPKNYVPEHMAVHGYRAAYAQALYRYYMEQGKGNGQLYYCKKERRGWTYDKGAVLMVSRALGHNRCDVVITSYFYQKG